MGQASVVNMRLRSRTHMGRVYSGIGITGYIVKCTNRERVCEINSIGLVAPCQIL